MMHELYEADKLRLVPDAYHEAGSTIRTGYFGANGFDILTKPTQAFTIDGKFAFLWCYFPETKTFYLGIDPDEWNKRFFDGEGIEIDFTL